MVDEPDESAEDSEECSDHGFETDAASSFAAGLGRDYAARMIPSFDFQRVMPDIDFRGIMPNLDFSGILAPHLGSLHRLVSTDFTAAMAPAMQNLQRGWVTSGVLDNIRSATEGLGADYKALLAGLRINLKPLVDPGLFDRFNRWVLPPNLRSASDKITMVEVRDFVESEGIPIYLVPRADIGVRLVKAPTRAARRQVLSDRFDAIVQDCTSVIDGCDDPMVATAVHFVRDGLGALDGGHHASAQAIFTLVLDTLIMEFFPDREQRRKITNRKPSDGVPEIIAEMGLHRAYVWLPIWHAHEQFWKDKGDAVPHTFSRHASVHGASKTQYSKRNCVQVLMLVTSLIGYTDQLAKRYRAEDESG